MLPKEQMVKVPTVYDVAHQAGRTTAQVDWVAIEKAPTITWAFREWAGLDGPLEQEMVAKGVLSKEDMESFNRTNIVYRDQIWTKAGEYLIRQHQPDLLLFHLLTGDSEQHAYRPDTLAATTALGFPAALVEKSLPQH